MEYQKIINLIGDDVESKFQTKDYVVINDRQAGKLHRDPGKNNNKHAKV